MKKRRLEVNLKVIYQHVQGGSEKTEAGAVLRMHSKGTRDNRHGLKQRRFSLGIRGEKITTRLIKRWRMLPREAAQCPPLVSRPNKIKL